MHHLLHLGHVLVAVIGAALIGREASLVFEGLEMLCDLLWIGRWLWVRWHPVVRILVSKPSKRYVQIALQLTLA